MTRNLTVTTPRGHRMIANFDLRLTCGQAARAAAICCGFHPDGFYTFAYVSDRTVLHRDDPIRRLADGVVLEVVDIGGSV